MTCTDSDPVSPFYVMLFFFCIFLFGKASKHGEDREFYSSHYCLGFYKNVSEPVIFLEVKIMLHNFQLFVPFIKRRTTFGFTLILWYAVCHSWIFKITGIVLVVSCLTDTEALINFKISDSSVYCLPCCTSLKAEIFFTFL